MNPEIQELAISDMQYNGECRDPRLKIGGVVLEDVDNQSFWWNCLNE
jgi:hypothetical protein